VLAKVPGRPAHGKAALTMLRDKGLVDQVAGINRMTPAQLTQVLTQDESAHLDTSGRMFYVEPAYDPASAKKATKKPAATPTPTATRPQEKKLNPGPAPVITPKPLVVQPGQDVASARRPAGMPAAGTSSAPAVAPGPFPYAQTFTLHSRPNSTKKIYLKFDGYTTTASSAWGAFVGTAFDTDGNPASFSTVEQDMIQGIWQRVFEDFAPFDIDVTTQDPGLAAIDRTDAADQNYGTRIVFTDSMSTLCPSGCAGVSYLGSIGEVGAAHEAHQPAWVFVNRYRTDAKTLGETASHEAGHTFGLH